MTNTATSLRRRELLKKLAAAGVAHSCGMLGLMQQAIAENLLDIKQGMISTSGEVFVNGRRSGKGLVIEPGQTVETGKGASAIYVIGANAFMQRGSSVVHFGTDPIAEFMRVVTGSILSVFGSGRKNINVPNATIGIRGTAFHIGVEQERTYFCLCYGEVEILLHSQNKAPLELRSSYHDRAIYIPSGGEQNIQPAKMIDHNDDELKLLEALVGRLPPFVKR